MAWSTHVGVLRGKTNRVCNRLRRESVTRIRCCYVILISCLFERVFIVKNEFFHVKVVGISSEGYETIAHERIAAATSI